MIVTVALSPNGKTLAIVERSDVHEWPIYHWGGGDVVQLWDVVTGELKRTLTVIAAPDIRSIAFSSDGKTLVGGTENVHVWDVETRQMKRTLTGHTRAVTSVVFSRDGRTLASGSFDGTVLLWDTETWERKQTITAKRGVSSVSFSPDGSVLASKVSDSTVLLWEMTD